MAAGERTSAQEDDYEDQQEDFEGSRSDDEGRERAHREEDSSDAAFDAGEEQEVGGEDDLEGEAFAETRPSRGSARLQRLANENAELRRQLASQNQPETRQQPAWPQEETEEQFNARVTLLPMEDRIAERQARSERRQATQLNFMMFQQRETADKSAYDAMARVDPRYKRMAVAVEAKQQELLRQGQWNSREAILKYLIGERIVSGQGFKEIKQRRQEGAERINRQTTQPSRGGSDVQRGGRRQLSEREARARRLDGQQI